MSETTSPLHDYDNNFNEKQNLNSKVFQYLTPFAWNSEESEIKMFNPGPWYNFCKMIILVLACFTAHLKVKFPISGIKNVFGFIQNTQM